MAQEGNSAQHADSDIVVGINGKYLVIAAPRFDPKNADHQHAFRRGMRDALTRNGQSAEKAGKLAEFAANPKLGFDSEGPTIGSMREEVARGLCREALLGVARINFAAMKAEDQEATVSKTLPIYMGKHPAKIAAALAAKLAAGYTPKQRGKGETAVATATVEVSADELP